MSRDYAKLHFVVILWGFTAILGELIQLESPVLVFYRVGLAGIILAILIKLIKAPGAKSKKGRIQMLANGLLLGTHWTLFFLAVKIANVSVCMIGMATTSMWTAILEPMLVKKRSFRAYEFGLGGIMIAAIALIVGSDFNYLSGLLIAIFSAGIGTLFSILNSGFTKKYNHYTIAFYQMIGATLIAGAGILLTALWKKSMPNLIPSYQDIGWMLLLVFFCTVYAYAQYIELLKRLSVFTIHLSYNLEPVYGMIFAALFFSEHHLFGPLFYCGTAIIFISVIMHPFLERRQKRILL
ncbi:MAG TPA: DMT family transporter [Verrucomicrobia bacterium]|nr:DMT family transporter [Verrucomicrobiales bacterium]HIL53603.1 DMT family transporter [Verrucomicrobiota bacterium]